MFPAPKGPYMLQPQLTMCDWSLLTIFKSVPHGGKELGLNSFTKLSGTKVPPEVENQRMLIFWGHAVLWIAFWLGMFAITVWETGKAMETSTPSSTSVSPTLSLASSLDAIRKLLGRRKNEPHCRPSFIKTPSLSEPKTKMLSLSKFVRKEHPSIHCNFQSTGQNRINYCKTYKITHH